MKVTTTLVRYIRSGFLPVLTLGVMPDAIAQKSAELQYVIRVEPAFSGSTAKYIAEALLAIDPNSEVSVDVPSQRVKVRTSVPVAAQSLQAGLTGSGLQVVQVQQVLPTDPIARAETIMATFGFPIYVDTGHPEQDQANYATAKSAWIDADPARYQELMRQLYGEPTPLIER